VVVYARWGAMSKRLEQLKRQLEQLGAPLLDSMEKDEGNENDGLR
jgi:hypothetical protein